MLASSSTYLPRKPNRLEGTMHRNDTRLADILAAPFLLIASLVFLSRMDRFIDVGLPSAVSPRTFPGFILACVAVLSFLFCILAVRAYLKPSPAASPAAAKGPTGNPVKSPDDEATSARGFVIYILILYVYRYLLEYVGFLPATPLVMLAVAHLLGGRRRVLLPCFVAFAFALDYLTFHGIRIELPVGAFFQ